jgi:hypothetical protein
MVFFRIFSCHDFLNLVVTKIQSGALVPPGRAIRIAGTLERFEEASEEDEERDT